VPQQWATGFVDIIRPMLVLHNAGVSTLPMEHELLTYPQFLSDIAPAYVSVNQSQAIDQNPQFAPIVFSARGAYTDITLISREVAEDTNQSGGLPSMLTGVIGQKYARLIDQVGIYGTAGNSGNPGLVNETGLIVQSMGTNGAAPADTTKPSLMAEASRAANAEPTAFVVNPQTYGTFARLNASTYTKYWDWPVDIKSIPWLYSSTLSNTEVQGSSGSVCSSAYLGPWDRMVIGMRIDLQVTVLRERYADFGAIGLQAYMRFSIRTTHPETFVRLNGILTT
jgi:HK97 family phage major capsid protein